MAVNYMVSSAYITILWSSVQFISLQSCCIGTDLCCLQQASHWVQLLPKVWGSHLGKKHYVNPMSFLKEICDSSLVKILHSYHVLTLIRN